MNKKISETCRSIISHFEEAQHAFADRQRIIIVDTEHSQKEQRYFCIGLTPLGVITVRFTYRNKKIRIFGAGFWRVGKKKYMIKLKEKSAKK